MHLRREIYIPSAHISNSG